jgi:hypothetical protein
MRTDTIARRIERPCSFDQFPAVLDNPTPAFTGIPRTLRDHVGYREFGDFGAVLMAERPASADLSNHVARWRSADRRDDLPLLAHPDQTAEDRRFSFLFVVTPIVIMLWVLIGLMVAWLKGAL